MLSHRAGFAFCAAALVGCGSDGPRPEITAVEPPQAYADREVRLMLTGTGLFPAFRLDPTSNTTVATMDGFSGRLGNDPNWVPLTRFGWLGPTQISATLSHESAEELTPGLYDIEISDPRGQTAKLPGHFTELGWDEEPPVLTLQSSPMESRSYWPGSRIQVRVTATDRQPGRIQSLTWAAHVAPPASEEYANLQGSCPIPLGASQVECAFEVPIGAATPLPATLYLDLTAADDSPHSPIAQREFAFSLVGPPAVDSISPKAGAMKGGTNVVIDGPGFQPGIQVFVGDNLLIPDGGILTGANTTISGYTPPHVSSKQVLLRDAQGRCLCGGQCDLSYPGDEEVPIRLKLPQGDVLSTSTFMYRSPPEILCLSPSAGRPGVDTPVTLSVANFTSATRLFAGQTTLAAATQISPTKWTKYSESLSDLSIMVPGSHGQTTFWAVDPEDGWSSLPNGFSWDAK
ncbi:MAG TPA: IPT/TIG domain-containing protein [Polyangia bacterium]